MRLLSCNIVLKIILIGEMADFYPVEPFYACNASCVVWLLLEAQTTSFTIKKIFCFRREAERRINSPTVEVNPMMRSIDALQLLISAIARFCDTKTIRSIVGLEPTPVRHL